MANIDQQIIHTLKNNAKLLSEKIDKKNKEGDTKGYIDCTRALKDTLDLIDKFSNVDEFSTWFDFEAINWYAICDMDDSFRVDLHNCKLFISDNKICNISFLNDMNKIYFIELSGDKLIDYIDMYEKRDNDFLYMASDISGEIPLNKDATFYIQGEYKKYKYIIKVKGVLKEV